jgi:hypothetical protein
MKRKHLQFLEQKMTSPFHSRDSGLVCHAFLGLILVETRIWLDNSQHFHEQDLSSFPPLVGKL